MPDNPAYARFRMNSMRRNLGALPMRDAITEGMMALPIAILVGAAIGLGHATWLLIAAAGAVGVVAVGIASAKAVEQPAVLVYWCVGAAIFFMPLNALRASTSVAFSDLLMTVAIPLTVMVVLSRHEPLRLPGWFVMGAVLIGVSMLLVELFPVTVLPASDVFANRNLTTGEQSTDSSLVLGVRLLFALIVVPTAIALAVDTWRQVRWLANAWIAGVAASSAVATLAAYGGLDLQQVLTGGEYFVTEFRGQPGRYAGLTVHPGALGLTVGMASPLIFARMTTLRRAAAYSPLLALFLAAVLVSGSRIGIIAVAVSALLVLAWQQRSRRQVAVIAVGAVVVVAALGSTSLSTIDRLTGETSAVVSDADHLSNYRDGLNLFLDRPLTGYGYQAVRGAHNVALQLLNSGGLLALAGFGIVMGGVLASGWKMRERLPQDMRTDALGLVIAVVVFLIVGMVSSAIFDRYLYIPSALLLAMLFLVQRQRLADIIAR